MDAKLDAKKKISKETQTYETEILNGLKASKVDITKIKGRIPGCSCLQKQ